MNVCTGGVSIALTAIGKLVGDLVVFPQGETTGGGRRQGGHIERSYEASIGTDRLSRS